jgi:hypothetical protein
MYMASRGLRERDDGRRERILDLDEMMGLLRQARTIFSRGLLLGVLLAALTLLIP